MKHGLNAWIESSGTHQQRAHGREALLLQEFVLEQRHFSPRFSRACARSWLRLLLQKNFPDVDAIIFDLLAVAIRKLPTMGVEHGA